MSALAIMHSPRSVDQIAERNSAMGGQGLGLAAVAEARARACVSMYSRIFVSLPFRTVMSKTQSSLNGLFVALIFPVATPTTRTRSPCATNSGGAGYVISISSDAFWSTPANPACPRCVPASAQPSPGTIHSISSATNANTRCLSPLPIAAKKSFTTWTFFSILIEISPFPLHRIVFDRIGRFGILLLGPTRTVVDRSLLLLEQILEDEQTPSFTACVHQ